jgi:hypothetical protein
MMEKNKIVVNNSRWEQQHLRKHSMQGRTKSMYKPGTSWKEISTIGGNYDKDEKKSDAPQKMFSPDVDFCQIAFSALYTKDK